MNIMIQNVILSSIVDAYFVVYHSAYMSFNISNPSENCPLPVAVLLHCPRPDENITIFERQACAPTIYFYGEALPSRFAGSYEYPSFPTELLLANERVFPSNHDPS